MATVSGEIEMILAAILTVDLVVRMGRNSTGLWHDAFYFNHPWQWAAQQGHGVRSVVALGWNVVQLWAWCLLFTVMALVVSFFVNLIW